MIFGATGDLGHRKILQALHALSEQSLLPEHFDVVGFARRDWTDEVYRAEMRQAIEEYSRISLIRPYGISSRRDCITIDRISIRRMVIRASVSC